MSGDLTKEQIEQKTDSELAQFAIWCSNGLPANSLASEVMIACARRIEAIAGREARAEKAERALVELHDMADALVAIIGAHGSATSRDSATENLLGCLYDHDALVKQIKEDQ